MNNPLQYHTTNNIAKSGFCSYVHRADSNLTLCENQDYAQDGGS